MRTVAIFVALFFGFAIYLGAMGAVCFGAYQAAFALTGAQEMGGAAVVVVFGGLFGATLGSITLWKM